MQRRQQVERTVCVADRGMPSADDLDAMRKQVLETDDIVIMDNLGSRKSRAVRQVIGQELHRSNSLQHFCSSRRPLRRPDDWLMRRRARKPDSSS